MLKYKKGRGLMIVSLVMVIVIILLLAWLLVRLYGGG